MERKLAVIFICATKILKIIIMTNIYKIIISVTSTEKKKVFFFCRYYRNNYFIYAGHNNKE